MLRAVLFDFDGTLADSYPAITASVNHVRAAHQLPPLTEEEVRRHVGHGPEYLLEHLVGGADVQENLALYRAHHPSVLRTGTQLLPGVGDALKGLKKSGLLLGICSNKPRLFTAQLVEYLGLRELIDVIVGPEDVRQIKPAPDMIFVALQRLTVRPDQALYVGDMVVDFQTGQAAGVRVWLVATGSNTREVLEAANPERLLTGLEQLPALISHLQD